MYSFGVDDFGTYWGVYFEDCLLNFRESQCGADGGFCNLKRDVTVDNFQ